MKQPDMFQDEKAIAWKRAIDNVMTENIQEFGLTFVDEGIAYDEGGEDYYVLTARGEALQVNDLRYAGAFADFIKDNLL